MPVILPRPSCEKRRFQIFEVDHADFGVEPLNGVSKGGEHPLCDILIGAGVNTPAAKWLRLLKLHGREEITDETCHA